MENSATAGIDALQVSQAFMDCLYNPEELKGLVGAPEGTIMVDGITSKFGFHPVRLEAKRTQVASWLNSLPDDFQKLGSGGASFLNACVQADGTQWTDLHRDMEQLFCLGMGLGLVKNLMPREMWNVLPGGMPYYVVSGE